MKIGRRYLALILAIALLVSSVPMAAAEEVIEPSDAAASLVVKVDDNTALPGDLIQAKVFLKAGKSALDLVAFQFGFTYDSTRFEVFEEEKYDPDTYEDIGTKLISVAGFVKTRSWGNEVGRDDSVDAFSVACSGGDNKKIHVDADAETPLFTITLRVKTVAAAGEAAIAIDPTFENMLTVSVDGTSQSVPASQLNLTATASYQIIKPNSIVVSSTDMTVAQDSDGSWMATVDPQPASNSHAFSVTYYDRNGEVSKDVTISASCNTPLSLDAAESAANPATYQLTVPSTVENSTSYPINLTVKAAEGEELTSGTFNITVQKDTPQLTTWTLEVGEYTISNHVGEGSQEPLAIPVGATDVKLPLKLTVAKDQYGVAMEDFTPSFRVEGPDGNNVTITEDRRLSIPTGTVGIFTLYITDDISVALSLEREESKATSVQFCTMFFGETEWTALEGNTLTLPIADHYSLQTKISAKVLDQYGELTDTTCVPKAGELPSYVKLSKTGLLSVGPTVEEGSNAPLTVSGTESGLSQDTTLVVNFQKIQFDTSDLRVAQTDVYGSTWAELIPFASLDFKPTLNGEAVSGGSYFLYVRPASGSSNYLQVTNATEDIPAAGTYDWKICYGNEKYHSYNDTFTVTSGQITIDPKRVSVKVTVEGGPYIYNGEHQTPTVKVELDGVTLDPDQYDVMCNSRDAGMATVSVMSRDGGNYSFSDDATFTIAPKPVTVSGITATDRNYSSDGDKTVELDATNATIDDLIDADAEKVTVDISKATGTMNTPDAGQDKKVTITGIKLTGDRAGNYTLSTAPITTTVNIGKSVLSIESKSTVYNGNQQSKYSATNAYSVSGNTATDAGEYTATLTLTNANNYAFAVKSGSDGKVTISEDGSKAEVKWNITKAAAKPNEDTTVTIKVPYVQQSVTIKGDDYKSRLDSRSTMTLGDASTTAKIISTTALNSESNEVVVTLSEAKVGNTATITIPYTSNNYEGGNLIVNIEIIGVEFTNDLYKVADGGSYGVTWGDLLSSDTSKWTAKLDGQEIKGTYTFTVDDAAYKASAVPNVGIRSWEVTFTSEDGRFKDVVVDSGEVVITPASLKDATVTVTSTHTYTGKRIAADDVTVTVTLGGKTLVRGTDYKVETIDKVATANTNEKYVRIGSDTGNYTGFLQVDLDVQQADLAKTTVTLTGVDGLKYNGEAQKPTGITVVLGDYTLTEDTDYTVSYSDDVTNAGEVTVTISAVEKGNFKGKQTKTYTIGKAAQAALTIKSEDSLLNALCYGGHEALSTTGGSTNGEVTWSITQGGDYAKICTLKDYSDREYKAIVATGVGQVEIKAEMAGDDNYNPVIATVGLTIPKCYVTLGTQAIELVYNATGEQTFTADQIKALLDATTANNPGMPNPRGTTVEIKSVSVTGDGILDAELKGGNVIYQLKSDLTKADADKTASIEIEYESNHFGSSSGHSSLTLKIKLVDKNRVTPIYTGVMQAYTGTEVAYQTATLPNGVTPGANPTWTYTIHKDNEKGEVVNEIKNVGEYYVTVVYEDDSNYGTASTRFKVNETDLTVTASTATKIYDGTAAADVKVVTFTGLVNGETLTADTDYTISNAEFADAKAGSGKVYSYQITLKDTEKAKNYSLNSTTVTAYNGVIVQKTITVTIGFIADQTYSAGQLRPEVTVSSTDLVGEYTLVENTDYIIEYGDNNTVGTRAGSVTVKSAAGSNYTFDNTTAYFNILPIEVAVPAAATGLKYNGSEQTGVSSGDNYTVSGGTATNAGSYTATVTLTDTDHYAWKLTDGTTTTADQQISWTIAKGDARTLADVTSAYRYSVSGSQSVSIADQLPGDAGKVSAAIAASYSDAKGILTEAPTVSGTTVRFNLNGKTAYAEGLTVTIPVVVTMENYAASNLNVVISLLDKFQPTVTSVGTVSKVYDGQPLELTNASIRDARAEYNGEALSGSWEIVGKPYVKGETNTTVEQVQDVGEYYVAVKFVPENGTDYEAAMGEMKLVIRQATPTISNEDVETEVDDDGKIIVVADRDAETLNDVLTADDFSVKGKLIWKQDGTEIPADTELEDLELEEITWSFEPTDSRNYKSIGGGIEEENSIPWWAVGALGGLSGNVGGVSPLNKFTDLDAGAWYAEAVEYCLDEGLMSGVSENQFAPNAGMTRAMVWTVLGRLSGETLNGTGAEWYRGAQQWAKKNGVSDGTNPNGLVTREELVTMLWRFAGSPKADTGALKWYSDSAAVSSWAAEAMAWAVSVQLVEGSNWNLTPGSSALRCQVAAIFMRYHKFG